MSGKLGRPLLWLASAYRSGVSSSTPIPPLRCQLSTTAFAQNAFKYDPVKDKDLLLRLVYYVRMSITAEYLRLHKSLTVVLSNSPYFHRETNSETGVTLLTMNSPKRLNGWTGPMMMAIRITMDELAKDPNTKVSLFYLDNAMAPFYSAVYLGCCVNWG